ncbi:hypothetical protein HYT56_04800, partial [Candidatus Woesearchaeota archaeon]|nr:hypothetical protein [Candidatus Woesearchaeota archaeon]
NAFNGQIIFFLADGEQSNWEIGSIWTVTPNGQKVETQYQYRYLPEFRTSIKIKDPETGEEEKFGTLEIIDNGRVVNSLLVTNKDFWKYLEKAQQRPFWNYEAYYWNGQDYKLPTKEGKDLQPGEKYSYLYGVDGPGQGNLDEEFREIVAILTTAKVRSLEIDRERLDSLPCGLIFNRCQDVKTHGWDSVGKRIFGLRN